VPSQAPHLPSELFGLAGVVAVRDDHHSRARIDHAARVPTIESREALTDAGRNSSMLPGMVSNRSESGRQVPVPRARPRAVPDTTLDRIRCPASSRAFPKNRCERPASGISPGTKKFFCKNVFHTKATPFIGRNHFWTGFCQRGHD
jgi:hypothetical protein